MNSQKLGKILLVEDEKDIRTVAQLALESVGGFELKLCESGTMALETVSEFQPDLFLLDVMMPGLDGPSTLKELRKIAGFENTPAIFMTAKVQPHEVEELKALGAIEVIAKPFDPMALSGQIQTCWQSQAN